MVSSFLKAQRDCCLFHWLLTTLPDGVTVTVTAWGDIACCELAGMVTSCAPGGKLPPGLASCWGVTTIGSPVICPLGPSWTTCMCWPDCSCMVCGWWAAATWTSCLICISCCCWAACWAACFGGRMLCTVLRCLCSPDLRADLWVHKWQAWGFLPSCTADTWMAKWNFCPNRRSHNWQA